MPTTKKKATKPTKKTSKPTKKTAKPAKKATKPTTPTKKPTKPTKKAPSQAKKKTAKIVVTRPAPIPVLELPPYLEPTSFVQGIQSPARPNLPDVFNAVQPILQQYQGRTLSADERERGKVSYQQCLSKGLFGPHWKEQTEKGHAREFTTTNSDCPCGAYGTVRSPEENIHKTTCEHRLSPGKISDTVALAVNPDAILRAEGLAYQFMERLASFGAPITTRLAWRVSPFGASLFLHEWDYNVTLADPVFSALEKAASAIGHSGLSSDKIWAAGVVVKKGESAAQAKKRVDTESKKAQPHLFMLRQKVSSACRGKFFEEDFLVVLLGATLWAEARRQHLSGFALELDPFAPLLLMLPLGVSVSGFFDGVLVLSATPAGLAWPAGTTRRDLP